MAGSIKGIIVEIGVDTSGLQKALKQVNSATSNLSKELNSINKMLKFDPKNTELLAQKQAVLSQNIQETTNKLNQLKQAQKLADDTIKNGGTISQENYRVLQREIIKTENQLKQLKVEASNWTAVSKSLDNISKKMKTVGDAVSELGTKFLGLTATIGAGITYGIKYNAQLEKYEKALTTLTGSAEEAQKIMQQIQEDAKTTPFDVAGLTQANQLLISTGLDAEESREVILALGNAVSATGGGNDELSRMAVNLQQIKNTGKAAAIDIKQFAYAGIDIYGLLADYLGISKEEAADMTVTWEDLSGALIHASKEGGKYFGAMEEQSKTFSGALSNAIDSFNQSLGSLTESLMPIATQIIQKLTEWMDKFNALDQETKNTILTITGLVATIGPVLIILGKVISVGGTIFGVISKIVGAIGGLTTGTGALSTALTALTGPIGIVVAAIAAIGAAFVYLFNTNEQFRNKVMEVWNNLVALFNETIIPAFNTIKEAVMSALNTVWGLWQQLWEKLEPFVTKVFTWFLDFWNNTLKGIIENVVSFITQLIQGWTNFYNNVLAPIISTLLDVLWPTIERVLNQIWSIVSGVFEAIGGAIKAVTGILDGLITFITGVFSGDWKKAWEGICKIFENIVNGLWGIIKTPLNWIIDGINGLIGGINGIKIPDWVPLVGGKSFNIPTIPRLAKGGIVDEATLAMVGEGKSAEAIIPLDRTLTRYMSEALKDAGASNNITINFYPQQMTEAELDTAFNYINRRFGLNY